VEAVHSAVSDARNTALANGVFNVDFIAGLAEKVSHFSLWELNN
jgi:tRNA/tmRNA/rRNA uracil-C5-methylase (TrmA/RlmC/RlmD family)